MPIMTCEHHRELFWMTKEQAVNNEGRYTGARNIFFLGRKLRAEETPRYTGDNYTEWAFPRSDDVLLRECSCSSGALICIDRDGGN